MTALSGMRAPALSLVAALLAQLPLPVQAVELSTSGFATLGYARSDRPYGYQRFIDDGGTLRRDSVAGLQFDAKATNELAATLQVKAAPASDSDDRFEASIAWAFVSWRPGNDWLLRAGKQRIPIYLYSETYDVGVTHDFARLPIEMYSIVSSNDFVGLSVSRSWRLTEADVSVDGYAGTSKNDYRFWFRDDVPGVQRSGEAFLPLEFKGGGLIATYRSQRHLVRAGIHRARIGQSSGEPLARRFPFVSIAPGIGYYQVSDALPGPGVDTARSVTNTTVTAGADLKLPMDVTLIAEWAWSKVPKSELAPKGSRGYAALLKPMGHWTPYVSYAFLRSPGSVRALYGSVNANRVPAAVPGAAAINASQRSGADGSNVYDQTSLAIGTSYAFSATSKLKAEVMRTRIGDVSKLVDEPPGGDVRHQSITVISLSYSVVF